MKVYDKEVSVEKTTKVLEITQKEYHDIFVEVQKETILEDKAASSDPLFQMVLSLSYAVLLGRIEERLFKQEEK